METRTVANSVEVETQTDANDDLEHEKEIEINEKGEIHHKPDETIVELKFGHDMENWEQVNEHIRKNLKMKVKGKPWLASSGRHFKIIAFKMFRRDFENWKIETLNWENIAKTVTVSRIYR